MREEPRDPAARRLLYQRVAELHATCLDQSFLSTVGPEFLTLMYEAIDEGPDSFLLVCRDGENIVGFITGALGMGPIYRRMLRNWARLLVALAPSIFSLTRLRRVLETIQSTRRTPFAHGLPKAELLSIGIDAKFRGRGYAELLYNELCTHFQRRGVHKFKIVVGSSLTTAHRFYRRMNAVPTTQCQVHKGQTSMVYVQTISYQPAACMEKPTQPGDSSV